MKKIYTILVICFLIIISANSVMAEGVTIGLDYLASGGFTDEGDSIDLTGFVLNGEYLTGKLKFNLDYGIFTLKGGTPFQSVELIGGYQLIEGLYVTSAFRVMLIDNAKSSFSSYSIGVDGSMKFNEKMNLGGTVGYAYTAVGSGSLPSTKTTGVSYGINFGYQLTEQVNLILKYKNEDYSQVGVGLNTITLGCTYNF